MMPTRSWRRRCLHRSIDRLAASDVNPGFSPPAGSSGFFSGRERLRRLLEPVLFQYPGLTTRYPRRAQVLAGTRLSDRLSIETGRRQRPVR